MIVTSLSVVDLMDHQPVPNAELTVSVDVVGRWPERITVDDLRSEFDKIGIAVPKDGTTVLVPDFDRAERVSQQALSDELGKVKVQLDADAAFARTADLKRDGVPPSDVGALLSVQVKVETLESEVRFLEGAFEEASSSFLGKNQSLSRSIPVDFGKSIVGHVTDGAANIFFRLHLPVLPEQVFVCEVTRFDPGSTTSSQFDPSISRMAGGSQFTGQESALLAASTQIDPDLSRANTAVARVSGLEPGTPYRYTLYLRQHENVDVPKAGRPLVRGAFTTDDPKATKIEFVFTSCHNPAYLNEDALRLSMNRWQALARRGDYEMLLLLGDQIYGDGIEPATSTIPWLDRYLQRYDRFWVYPELREVLRRTPTYMMLDDHDVLDDFGVKPIPDDLGGAQREGGALLAYETFQQSHGPDGPGGINGPKFYHFRRGPAAFFMIDNRTQRANNPAQSSAPILGGTQRRALTQWADEIAASDVDLVFLAVPVPIAFLPVEKIQDLKKELEEKAAALGGIGGFVLGPLANPVLAGGGFFSGALGAAVGYHFAHSLLDEKGLVDLTDRDLADMWTFGPNQKDLVFLMDLLYRLANDLQADGKPGDRPRAVFLLGGDVHLGVFHLIQSYRDEHRRNPYILQAISSPISNRPVAETLLHSIVRNIHTGDNVETLDLLTSKFDAEELVKQTFGERNNALFVLDDQHDRKYVAEFVDLLTERNFGRVTAERISSRRRFYRFSFTVEGATDDINCTFLLDLDAPHIRPFRDHATFVKQSVPKEIEPVQPTTVSVTMRNSGVSTWTPGYHLESLSPAWGIETVALPQARVSPGETVTFRFKISALSRGDFRFQWRMGRQFKAQFGNATPRRTIRVGSETGSAACAALKKDLAAADQRLRSFQRELQNAAPALKPFLTSQIDKTRGEIRALQARARRLGCP